MELIAENLGCTRAGRRVFSGQSFRLSGGQAMLLRGPNGAGKSTLLRGLAGLLPFDAGSVTLDGQSLQSARDDWQEKIAYAGHLDAIKPQLTVAENLIFWAKLFGGDADAAFDTFALSDIADRPAHMCSAGQKRRLGLARLMVSNRPLWLLDEPTVSLDAATVARFAQLVRDHCAAGGAALIATHIDLGLPDAQLFELSPFAASDTTQDHDPFLAGDWT